MHVIPPEDAGTFDTFLHEDEVETPHELSRLRLCSAAKCLVLVHSKKKTEEHHLNNVSVSVSATHHHHHHSPPAPSNPTSLSPYVPLGGIFYDLLQHTASST